MTPEQVAMILRRRPFPPLVIHMQDGQRYRVHQAEAIWQAPPPDDATIVFQDADDQGVILTDTSAITQIVFPRQPPSSLVEDTAGERLENLARCLREARNRVPFVPFTIQMKDGTTHEIRHADGLLIPPGARLKQVQVFSERGGSARGHRWLALDQIAEILGTRPEDLPEDAP